MPDKGYRVWGINSVIYFPEEPYGCLTLLRKSQASPMSVCKGTAHLNAKISRINYFLRCIFECAQPQLSFSHALFICEFSGSGVFCSNFWTPCDLAGNQSTWTLGRNQKMPCENEDCWEQHLCLNSTYSKLVPCWSSPELAGRRTLCAV